MTTAFMAFSSANRRSVRPWSQAGRDAAVDKERVPVDERRCISGQKHRSADQLVDIAPARSWRPLFEPCREGGIINQRLVQRCLEIARRDRIDLQTMLRPIGAHAAREIADR